jgi:hypothetical protein
MGLRDNLRDIARAVGDTIRPPSTLELAQRAISDAWKNEVKPLTQRLDKELRGGLADSEKILDDLVQDPKRCTKQLFDDMADTLSDLGSRFPVMTKFIGFIKSAGSLLASISGSNKGEQTKAWDNFNHAKVALCNAIKKAVGIDTPSQSRGGRH